MKRKLMITILCAGLLAGLTGCAETEKASAPTASDGIWTPMDIEEDSEKIDLSEHAVIVYMTIGTAPTNGATQEMLDQLNVILKEKVNAELAICYIGWEDYQSVYRLTLEQMDGRVDLVGTSSQWLNAWTQARNGLFLGLTEEMLQTYAPMTWESVSDEHWEACKFHDSIYLIPEDHYLRWTHPGYAYRQELADEAGLEEGIHSWEELSDYFQYVGQSHPDQLAWNMEETQYESLASGWMRSHSSFIPIEGLGAGQIWGANQEKPDEIYSPYMTETDSLVEFAKLMKEWNRLGVWKQNASGVATNAQRCEEGRGFVSGEDGFFCFGEENGNITEASITQGAMAVCASSRHPERALMVYDLLRNDPDCYRLFNYGIQGKQWEIDGTGHRIRPDSYEEERDAITTNYWWGRNDELEIDDDNRSLETVRRRYDVYGQFIREYPYESFRPDMSSMCKQMNELSEIHTDYMTRITFGEYEQTAEEIVAEYQTAMRQAGVDKVTESLQKQMKGIIP